MSEDDQAGPPPSSGVKRPKKGKGSALLIRVTQSMRDALDQEAAATGQSLSHIAELWLEDARAGHTDLISRAGSVQVAGALDTFAAVARAIISEMGDPAENGLAFHALQRAWEKTLRSSGMRTSARNTPEVRTLLQTYEELRTACRDLLSTLAAAPTDDVVRMAAFPPNTMTGLAARYLRPDALANAVAGIKEAEPILGSAGEVLSEIAEGREPYIRNKQAVRSALDALLAAGTTAVPQIKRVWTAFRAFEAAQETLQTKIREAQVLGEDIAARYAPLDAATTSALGL